MRWSLSLAVVVALAALATACGGGGEDPPGTSRPDATETVGPAATSTRPATPPRGPAPRPTLDVGPGGEAFYTPPDPLPPGEPGTIIWANEVEGPAGSVAWKVLYHSRALDGRDIAVSGFVVAPANGPAGSLRPVVSWAHGTTGLADQCSPSLANAPEEVIPGLADLLAAGYVVVATDYEGLGTPGVHPYIVGESEGRGVLDIVRAASWLPTYAGNRLLLFGHSQGGHAVLFAGQIAASYAPELQVLGVVAGAPATELSTIADILPDTPFFGYLLMAGAGFDAAYEPDLSAEFVLPGAQDILGLMDTVCAGEILAALEGRPPAEVLAKLPSDDPVMVQRIEENTPGNLPIGAPVLVFHGTVDEQIPAILSNFYTTRACATGTQVELRYYAGADHVGALIAAGPEVLGWLADRLAGAPAGSSCGAVPEPG